MTGTQKSRDEQKFYVYASAMKPPVLDASTVFYTAADRESAAGLCRLFGKEYPPEKENPEFFFRSVAELDLDDRVLLDESLVSLELYEDPDPGVYEPTPPKDVLLRAQYARRALAWEAAIALEKEHTAENNSVRSQESSGASPSGNDEAAFGDLRMSPEERRNSALNLLFLLAHTYYRILEAVVSSSSYFCALDLELNESYLWTVSNLENLLANHEDLRDFPMTFEPVFPDLYPSTIVDVDWQDMVAPDVERFLSTVQRYVRSKGIHEPDQSSLARGFVELFRPAAEEAIGRAQTYAKRMQGHTRKVFGPKPNPNGSQHHQGGKTVSSVFISYSWDDDAHRDWVHELAKRLRADGVDVSIDRWAMVPGDQLPAFMERVIRENQYVVIICTPRYKSRSDAREGGVGYEGDIMTAEVLTSQNHRKFIPVLRSGDWKDAAPSWLSGKYYVNLNGTPYSERHYEDLVRTLLGVRESAPALGRPFATITPSANRGAAAEPPAKPPAFEDIKITRVIVEDITEPLKDGTRGSALYSIPFALSAHPPSDWEELFLENWNHPTRFTTMHRPGIASVSGATVILDGTTIEEVERYHRDTLQLAITETNRQYRNVLRDQEESGARSEAKRDAHRKRVEDASKRIKFD